MIENKYTKELFSLKGKSVIITGGAGLLGKSYASVVTKNGGIPILLDIDKSKIDSATKEVGGKCVGYEVDITKKEDIEEIAIDIKKNFHNIDVLINNAAIDPKVSKNMDGLNVSRFENYSLDNWNNEIEVGLTGAFLCSQIFGREMEYNGKGVILNISSDLGIIAPDQTIYRKENETENDQSFKPVTYSVIKHGIIGLTKYLSSYWGTCGIRVNAIAPGGVFNDQPEEFVKKLTSLIPLGRMANLNEYQGAVLFLISDASKYITGTTIVIDGGRSIR